MNREVSLCDKAIVVFLDILGYKNMVDKMIDNTDFVNKFDDLMYGITVDMLNELKNISLADLTQDETLDVSYFKNVVDTIKIRFIYDNIIFSLPLSDISFGSREYDKETTVHFCIETLFSFMSLFSTLFIGKTGHLLRGGISIGSHYESEKDNYLMIFSEAHNKAVYLESEANYPRIILEESLRGHLDEISYPHIDKFFYKDHDGHHCFDIYSIFHSISSTKKVLADINKGLLLNMESNISNKKELSKLIYFAKYHNRQVSSSCLNFPDFVLNIDKYEKIVEQ